MKKATLFIILFLSFSVTANAQFFKKLGDKVVNAAEKTIEKKAEQKTKKETEKAFDSTFNKKRKKKKIVDKPRVIKSNPQENYAFNHIATMQIESDGEIQNFDYYLPKNSDYFGMKIKGKKANEEFMIVYDVASETMFTFMENGGQKMKIGTAFKANSAEDKSPDFKIKATGNTKKIQGYNCKEYRMTGEDMAATIWVTKDVDIRFPSTLQNDKKNTSNNQEWLKDIDGWAMQMTMIDSSKRKPQTIIMNCLSIQETNFKINTNTYQNIGR